LIYTSTVATIAGERPQNPNEFTRCPKLEEMVGPKRSKWMAEKKRFGAVKKRIAGHWGQPTTPVGPWDGSRRPPERYLAFLNGQEPAMWKTGLNLSAWKRRGRAPG